MTALDNYRRLVAKVDAFWLRASGAWAEQLACRAGCSDCSQSLSLLPVEAEALGAAFRKLPVSVRGGVLRRLEAGGEGCPLLDRDRCLLYEARPVICRTQGLPLRVEERGGPRVDTCSRNFRGVTSLPGDIVLDLETLNRALAAVDGLFVREFRPDLKGRRLAMAEILREG